MKCFYLSGRIVLGISAAVIAVLVSTLSTIGLEAPTIAEIRQVGSNILVEVQVPVGLRMVRVESRNRIGSGSWAPRAIARLDGQGGQVRFTLPNRSNLELIRVSAAENESLPESFYQGTNQFGGVLSDSGYSILYARSNFGAAEDTAVPSAGAGGGGSAPRTVAESDIWKVDGNRIYFFNMLRGLQVIDIEAPDHPVLRGTLSLPAAGEQMYLLEGEIVVLLVQANCYFGGQQSQVLLVSAKEPQPKVIARLSMDGYISESRMVGTALYVATQTYQTREEKGQTVYTSGTLLNSFDLSDPAAPRSAGSLWYPGYNSVVAATDRLFFVVNQDQGDWSRSVIHTADITSPTGEMAAYVSIRPAGLVRDKFKVDYQGTRFTCISEEVSDGRRTRLETFFLADPRSAGPVSVRKEGELKLAERESLFATRFDGDKAYIVTFQRIDPLFIVDLSNSAAPKMVAELEVPGFSTYIQPLGDRLVTVGTETNRVAVSLFDVQNPAKPALLSRVLLGNSYSWSESLWNEKAVSILPDQNLILVPYSGDTTNGYASRVQLIDLFENQLKARGLIERVMEPRRATLHGGRIYSISSRELLTVEATDRDHPQVKDALDLSWSVDRLFVKGDYLLELSNQGYWWGAQTLSQLRVASFAQPDRALATLTLSNLPIAGAVLQGDVLHLAQAAFSQWGWVYAVAESDGTVIENPGQQALFTTIDVRDPREPKVIGQTTAVLPAGTASDWQALWPRENVLVWFAQGGFGGYFMPFGFAGRGVADVAFRPWGWYSAKPLLVALDVRQPAAPVVDSIREPGKDTWWGISSPFAAEGLVYFSHQESEPIEDPATAPKAGSGVAADAEIYRGRYLYPPFRWLQRHFLDVVDYADSRNPTFRETVSLPGALQGLSLQGQLIYTLDQELDASSSPTGVNVLSALAYDGVAAHRVDSVSLDRYWSPVIQVSGRDVFVGRPELDANSSVQGGRIETWQLAMNGKWERRGAFGLPAPVQRTTQRDQLLIAGDQSNVFHLLDATDPASLKEVGRSERPGCWWGDITKGDGDLGRGFWIPLGDYGVVMVPRAP